MQSSCQLTWEVASDAARKNNRTNCSAHSAMDTNVLDIILCQRTWEMAGVGVAVVVAAAVAAAATAGAAVAAAEVAGAAAAAATAAVVAAAAGWAA